MKSFWVIVLVAICVTYFGYKYIGESKKDDAPVNAQVMVLCNSDVEVRLDGVKLGGYRSNTNGWVMADITPGQYRIEAFREGCETQSCWIAVAAGSNLSVTLDPFVELPKPEEEVEKEEIAAEEAPVVDEKVLGKSIDLGGGVMLELVWCPPGTFTMGPGSDMGKEHPAHEVTISKGFWVGRYEITQAQYRAVIDANPSNFKGDKLPVERVGWKNAVTFCETLSQRSDIKCRLPAEAEWEYAARAGGAEPKRSLDLIAWYSPNSGKKTHLVGKRGPNAWGLFDTLGNVWEWCSDWVGDYEAVPAVDPVGPEKGGNKILRGGAWNSPAQFCSTTFRYGSSPINSNHYLGFRVVVEEELPEE